MISRINPPTSDQSVIDEFFEVFNQTKSNEIKKKFGFDKVLNPSFTHIGCYHYTKQCSETVMYSTEYFTKMRVVDTKGRALLPQRNSRKRDVQDEGAGNKIAVLWFEKA
ncbi:hypothetical protein CRE_29026 [Caenorhabditis remanei]|uniref:Uncharacterized protein n=1 Tax=Caenorhabditis remanei TaxID=31234 RepID=E3NA60_CAERE|nr:hypothetical protein CRE_29026 [Caenorhabditis remanei]